MNDLLAQIYGTDALVKQASMEKTAEEQMLDELVKVAAEEGIDLNSLSDDDIAEVLVEALYGGQEKTAMKKCSMCKKAGCGGRCGGMGKAASDESELTEEDQTRLADADFLGRVMAHSLYAELSGMGGVEKTASDEDFDATAMAVAEQILAAAQERAGGQEKTAADDEAELSPDQEVLARALEILDANDYDVDRIVELLS